MSKVKNFIGTYWKHNKYSKEFRAGNLKELKEKLLVNKDNKCNIYLLIGSLPKDATKSEVKLFLKDIQVFLKENFSIEESID